MRPRSNMVKALKLAGKVVGAVAIFIIGSVVFPADYIVPLEVSRAKGEVGHPLLGIPPSVLTLYGIVAVGGMVLWVAMRKRPAVARWWWVLLPLGGVGIVTLGFLVVAVILFVIGISKLAD